MNYNKLEEARKDKGITVSEVCRRLDINRSTWYRWIKGERTAPLEKMLKACLIIGIDVNELLN
jgi:transcriptional regulator with XRE-family HTH domain